MAAVRHRSTGGRGVDGMTGPADEYLGQLRASLRTRPAEQPPGRAEITFAVRRRGLRAGMTDRRRRRRLPFGSVRLSPRHQTRRARRRGAGAAPYSEAPASLLAFRLRPALLASRHPPRPQAGARRRAARRPCPAHRRVSACSSSRAVAWRAASARGTGAAPARAAGYFPLAAAIFFGAGTIAQILLIISGTHVGGLPILATLALAIGYGIRMRWTRRPRRRASQKNGTSVPA